MFCRQINDDELLIESPYLLARRVLVLQISEPHENQQMQLARRVTWIYKLFIKSVKN